nr:unnamed protein product [Callosobruchus chinensis]
MSRGGYSEVPPTLQLVCPSWAQTRSSLHFRERFGCCALMNFWPPYNSTVHYHRSDDSNQQLLEYCSLNWGASAPTTLSILDAVQRRAIRLIGDPALT